MPFQAPLLAKKLYGDAEMKGRKLSGMALKSMYFINIVITTFELIIPIYNMAIGNLDVATWTRMFIIEYV